MMAKVPVPGPKYAVVQADAQPDGKGQHRLLGVQGAVVPVSSGRSRRQRMSTAATGRMMSIMVRST